MADGLGQLIIPVGSRPFDQDPELWKKVGADGSPSSAEAAVKPADLPVKEKADFPRALSD